MNQTGILRRCIEELKKDDFRKDYVLGMLEALVEIDAIPSSLTVATPGFGPGDGGSTPSSGADEASILDARARASIADIAAMAAESHE